MKLMFGRLNSRSIFNLVSQFFDCQKSNISRVMKSEVNKLIMRPTVSDTPKPLS